MEPERKPDMRRGAELAVQFIRAAGGRAEVVPTGGHPVVVGGIDVGASRTLTVYNHLDVQPAVLEDGWEHEPFVFRKVGERYDVVDVLRNAIGEWREFIAAKGV